MITNDLTYHHRRHRQQREEEIPDLVDLGAAASNDTADEVIGNFHLVYVVLNEPGRCAVVGTGTSRRSRAGVTTDT